MPYRSEEINTNLLKGSARVQDVLHLLRAWDPADEDPTAFQERAVEENLPGKASRKRAADLVKRVVGVRYFPEGARVPAAHVARLVEADVPTDVVTRVLYYHAALAERLLYVVATDFLYERRRRGLETVGTPDVVRYVREQARRRAMPEYSDSTLEKVAQAALAALRDFGILEGKAKKRITPVRIPHEATAYVAYALHDDGLSANRIVEHRDWRLFLLDERAAEEAIITASQHGYFTYSAAGTIRRFDWRYDSLDELIDGLT